APGRPAEQVAAAVVGAHAVGEDPLVGPAPAQQQGAGAVAEQRVGLDVGRVEDARVAVPADDQRQVAGAGDDVGGAGDQGVEEAGAGGLDLDGGAAEPQPVLHQASGRGERHVGGEGPQDEQVDVLGVDPGVVEAAQGGLLAQVAGGLVGQGVPAFQDAGA